MSGIIQAAFVVTLLLSSAIRAGAQEDFQPVRVFPQGDGPLTNLMKSPDGNLYGLSSFEVYKITPVGEYVSVAPFNGDVSGFGILASDGRMHFSGGARVTLAGEVTQIHVFEGALDFSPVIQAVDGYLYGTTSRDGAFRRGTVYRMTVDGGDFTVLHSFTPAEQPEYGYSGPITQGADGNFYINAANAEDGVGAIYRMTPDGSLSTFRVGTSSQVPLFLASDGHLYGLNIGHVYRLNSDGSVTIVHSFTQPEQTAPGPISQFTDGNLYFLHDGTIFRLTLAGELTPLHRARTSPEIVRYGRIPFDLLEGQDGNYYGVTFGGGGSFGREAGGTVFRLNSKRSPCANVVEMLSEIDNQYLYVTQFVKSETPAIWGSWMITQSAVYPLWLTVTPAISPTFGFELAYYPFPKLGIVGVVSIIVTSESKVCTDWKSVDTGSGK